MDVCPTNAISWKGFKVTKPGEENKQKRLITRSITAILMAALLIGAIVYYWNDDSNQADTVISAEHGNEVGDLCFGYDLEIIDSTGLTGATINPTTTGKITIINFWGTWCTPCVNELPYFDQIASDYQEDVSVIAIHTNMVSDTAAAFIQEYYPESDITFARDGETEAYYATLGGRGTYPYTVVIDENGLVVKIFFEALEYEDLKEVVEANLN